MGMSRVRWRQVLTIGVPAVSLYVTALALPAALVRGQTFSGFGMLEAGALAFIFGLPPTLAWLLNLLLPAALVFLVFGWPRSAFLTAITAVLLGYAFTMSAEFLFDLPWDEAGGRARIEQLYLGFWLWLAAPALVAVAAGVELYMVRTRELP